MDTADTFHTHRPRLLALAYRLLGSRADAEDVVQDAWLRWHQADQSAIVDPLAWLVTATTRLGIDRLRALRARREHYVGPWLPEPARIEEDDGPAGDVADHAPGPARAALESLLHADARLVSDGGGKAVAVIRPLLGGERIARLFWAAYRRQDPAIEWRIGRVNGEPAILRYRGGVLAAVMVAVTDGERITELFTVANPDKLGVTNAAAGASW